MGGLLASRSVLFPSRSPAFIPLPAPFSVGSRPLARFWFENVAQLCIFFKYISPASHLLLGNPAFLSLERTTTEVEDFRFLFFFLVLLLFFGLREKTPFPGFVGKGVFSRRLFFVYLYSFCTCIRCMCVSLAWGGGGRFMHRYIPIDPLSIKRQHTSFSTYYPGC